MLTNDIISFEQLGLGVLTLICHIVLITSPLADTCNWSSVEKGLQGLTVNND